MNKGDKREFFPSNIIISPPTKLFITMKLPHQEMKVLNHTLEMILTVLTSLVHLATLSSLTASCSNDTIHSMILWSFYLHWKLIGVLKNVAWLTILKDSIFVRLRRLLEQKQILQSLLHINETLLIQTTVQVHKPKNKYVIKKIPSAG